MNAKGRERFAQIEREVEDWPGVTVQLVEGGTHPKAKFTFDGKILSHAFAGTSGDTAFGARKMLGDMRRVMRQLGAERSKPEPTAEEEEREYRKPNDGAAKRQPVVQAEPIEVKPGLSEQLAVIVPEAKLETVPAVAKSVEVEQFKEDFDIGEPRRIVAEPGVDRSGWGLYTDFTAEEYHLDPCPEPSISNSLMDPILNKTLADFAHVHPRLNEDPELRKATAAMARGDVVHQLTLGKGRGIAIYEDGDDWKKKAAQEFKKDAEESGLTPITRKAYDEADILAGRLKRQIAQALDGADYQTEVVGLYQEQTDHGPIWVRFMMDVWCPERNIILDPKITGLLYDGKIERHALNMGWDRQSALYPHAVGMIEPERAGRVTFADLLINPDPPYVSRLWAPEKSWEYSSVKQCRIAFERFGRGIRMNDWPGFSPKMERGVIPSWEGTRRETMEIKEL